MDPSNCIQGTFAWRLLLPSTYHAVKTYMTTYCKGTHLHDCTHYSVRGVTPGKQSKLKFHVLAICNLGGGGGILEDDHGRTVNI